MSYQTRCPCHRSDDCSCPQSCDCHRTQTHQSCCPPPGHFSDHVRALSNSAKSLSSNANSVPDAADVDGLERILHAIAQDAFLENYGYAYNGDSTAPHDLGGAALKSIQNIVFAPSGDHARVSAHFGAPLSEVPSWAAEQFRAQLVGIANSIFAHSEGNKYVHAPFNGSYRNPDGSGNSIEVRAVFVHAKFGADNAHSVVYYSGVYFGV